MEPDFWLDRWNNGDIGFHRDAPHPSLQRYWPALNPTGPGPVFVPLCGKSRDMVWLAGAGHRVIGVELSELAIVEFFLEQGLEPEVRKDDQHTVFSSSQYSLWCGDIFAMPASALAEIVAVYDRASLVALPPALQDRYADFLGERLPSRASTLLISLDYHPSEMDGPPFSTPPHRVDELFARAYSVDRLETADALEANGRLRERGLTALRETCYVLHRKT